MTNYYGKCSQWQNELETEIINKSNGMFDRDDFDGSSYIARETEEYFNLGTQKMFNQTQWLNDSQVEQVKKHIKLSLYEYIMGMYDSYNIDDSLSQDEIDYQTKKYKFASEGYYSLLG